MAVLNREQTERIAALAKLDISGESDSFIDDINDMLEIMSKLSTLVLPDNISISRIDPDELVNTYREDEADESRVLPRELVLANAPEVEAGCISVPK